MLAEALQSIEEQEFSKPLEIIQANNMSEGTDRLNNAIRRSSGEYILILSDDDKLTKNFLSETEKALDKGYDIASSFIKPFGVVEESAHGPGKYPFFTTLFRKSFWEKVGGFDTDMGPVGDVDFWHRCLEAGAKWYRVPNLFYWYRKHPGQDSNTADWETANKKFNKKHNL